MQIYKDDKVVVYVTNDKKDGVFVTVDFIASNKIDGDATSLGYRIWAQDSPIWDSVEVEIYDYQNDAVCESNTFDELVLGFLPENTSR